MRRYQTSVLVLMAVLVLALAGPASAETAGGPFWQAAPAGAADDEVPDAEGTAGADSIAAGSAAPSNDDVTGNYGRSGATDPRTTRLGAGPSALQWQRCLGGTDRDRACAVGETSDGGAIVAAFCYSTDGDLSGVPGAYGLWLLKLDSSGVLQWQKFLGGSSLEGANVEQTTDGGYLVAATTWRFGGLGHEQFWVLKLDAAGTLQWQSYLGGGGSAVAYSVRQTADSGYVVAGCTDSNDGDVAGNHGGMDAWVVKLDAAGVLQWQRCLGGTGNDYANSVRQTADGGYVVAGNTYSDDGDFAGSHGHGDAWIAKLDAAGNLIWRRCLGGSYSETASAVRQTADHGYIVAGSTSSNDGDVSGSHGQWEYDAWVVKLTPTGGLSWQRCLGGTGHEEATGVEQTADSGYIMTGTTESNDGDVAGNHGISDVWVVKLDAGGAPARQECFGGTEREVASALDAAEDSGFLLAGWTCSNDGDVTGYHWGLDRYDELTSDIWVVKLTADAAPFLVRIPGALGLPKDTDADGLYEDVNGNGRRDFADVVLYFNQLSWIAANEQVSLLDYNGNSGIDFADVVWLFNTL